jgi:hypothetical protein
MQQSMRPSARRLPTWRNALGMPRPLRVATPKEGDAFLARTPMWEAALLMEDDP